jgi:hypothetical protein
MPPRELIALVFAALAGVGAAAYLLRPKNKNHKHLVAAVIVYPIKSCRGVPMTRARTDQYGFELDRNW